MSTATITILLAGNMQYWGASSGQREKRTRSRPTKSGVIGLVANALGRDYSDSIDDLAALRFAVAVDKPGRSEIDFKTAGTVDYPALPGDSLAGCPVSLKASPPLVSGAAQKNPDYGSLQKGTTGAPKTLKAEPKLIQEHYLADAQFRVALAGDSALIDEIHKALQRPARAVYLGRRAYSPSKPLVTQESVTSDDLESVAQQWGSPAFVECAPNAEGATLVADNPERFGNAAARSWRAEKPLKTIDFFSL